METQDLKGKRALVTGGTKGIGKAIADELAAAGAQVIVTARTKPWETPHHFIAADLTNAGQVAELAKQITDTFGGIDILINNAGGLTTPGGGHSTLTDAHWQQELDLNLISAIRLDRILLPQMIGQKSGVVIHMSSVSGKQALWNLNLAYAVSKAALNSYSKALATELADKGVRVLTVSPGATRTEPMMKFLDDYCAAAGITPEEGMKQLMIQTGGIPMGRMAEPEEVAHLVHFLVSPSAAYLTGSVYAIDGGSLPVVG
ncbi:NAD(P)-dependent dehydrogenase (short-subunit alcohol dehydrogenase family) [Mucilaginibacter oryzae]|uniref:NAD(P)-dependent dehydrogenase (Short-subunit alcohol dehydrogenase family) n=1 Tax=Mucilaginibacter oryzae TaxID=468058 RepID=A0A316HAP2_9SPHI|nr:SDR family oxidoreductase [Mucilaginibacter oryzae]PWK77363.1 NAD(P)-dependent dehydrogenase (short-subunit alcohol dehydrogenase family) [Mucilaginibacter oryzae]